MGASMSKANGSAQQRRESRDPDLTEVARPLGLTQGVGKVLAVTVDDGGTRIEAVGPQAGTVLEELVQRVGRPEAPV